MKTFTLLAPAKINLTLDVFPVQDGFHPLRSLMQTISLFDRVTLTISENGKEEIVSETFPEAICDDICVKAIRSFLLRYPKPGLSFRVRTEKKIPVSAGLGGGSSDAAAVLQILADQTDGCTPSVLNEIAASVGSDVPFFLYGGLCLVEGRGEIVTPLPYRPEQEVFLAKPKNGASSGTVYTLFDSLGLSASRSTELVLEAIRENRDFLPYLSNDLAEAAVQAEPESGILLKRLQDLGAEKSLISGSGSTCLGFFQNGIVPSSEELPEAVFCSKHHFVYENSYRI